MQGDLIVNATIKNKTKTENVSKINQTKHIYEKGLLYKIPCTVRLKSHMKLETSFRGLIQGQKYLSKDWTSVVAEQYVGTESGPTSRGTF